MIHGFACDKDAARGHATARARAAVHQCNSRVRNVAIWRERKFKTVALEPLVDN